MDLLTCIEKHQLPLSTHLKLLICTHFCEGGTEVIGRPGVARQTAADGVF